MWTLFAAATVAHASAFVELDYAPIGRGDLAWNDAGQQSGTLVAEGDGIVVPPLRASIGWVAGRWAFSGGGTVARIASFTTTSATETAAMRTAIRSTVMARRWLMEPEVGRPLFALHARLHAVIPGAASSEDAATADEQEAIDQRAEEDAGRIRSAGGAVGFSALHRWSNGIGVGFKSSLQYSRSAWTNSQTVTVSSLLRPETTLTVSFWF
ncbi:MAG: hypothetical protein VX944_03280 [Myxococcota bacterium]|nr:hypothetical protein [Myxococcota bacterium]MEC9389070.1 hypothetical protein [Myxococcota bacterium]